jgi:hypothetical protein
MTDTRTRALPPPKLIGDKALALIASDLGISSDRRDTLRADLDCLVEWLSEQHEGLVTTTKYKRPPRSRQPQNVLRTIEEDAAALIKNIDDVQFFLRDHLEAHVHPLLNPDAISRSGHQDFGTGLMNAQFVVVLRHFIDAVRAARSDRPRQSVRDLGRPSVRLERAAVTALAIISAEYGLTPTGTRTAPFARVAANFFDSIGWVDRAVKVDHLLEDAVKQWKRYPSLKFWKTRKTR